ncbi:MAG: dTDP-4-amino-4,6-dideoxygalactose transaminase [Planctomycetota bacterium]|jgi:dTDP-4-amino-4,6-dideoxygalactose transaminase
MKKISFNRPYLAGKEFQYIREAIANLHISGDGPFSDRVSLLLEQVLSTPRIMLTPSCTHALEICALLLDLKPGDEVIVPSFTFVTTVNAFVMHGARPVFVDIREDTLNIDESLISDRITEKTRAVVTVHYAGVGCEMDSILNLAHDKKLDVIEDNAHGLFAKYRGRALGTMGRLGVLSFHETKNFSCGEGGAIIVNDPALIDRAEVIREKGTDRQRFFRGEVDKYTWVDYGSSYLLSDALSAFLCAQLEERERILALRHDVWRRYHDGLKDWAEAGGVRLPWVPDHCEQSFHMFYLVMPTGPSRDGLIRHLGSMGISAIFHFVPLHSSAMAKRLSGGKVDELPVTDDMSARLVRLPFYNELSPEDQGRIIETVRDFIP